MDDTLDVDQCAAFLKVNRSTVLDLLHAGELPGAKVGRAWVFPRRRLLTYLDEKIDQHLAERKAHIEKVEAASIAAPTVRSPLVRRKRGGQYLPTSTDPVD